MTILTCVGCGYERSTEEDGRSFDENDNGDLICSECVADLADKADLHVNLYGPNVTLEDAIESGELNLVTDSSDQVIEEEPG